MSIACRTRSLTSYVVGPITSNSFAVRTKGRLVATEVRDLFHRAGGQPATIQRENPVGGSTVTIISTTISTTCQPSRACGVALHSSSAIIAPGELQGQAEERKRQQSR